MAMQLTEPSITNVGANQDMKRFDSMEGEGVQSHVSTEYNQNESTHQQQDMSIDQPINIQLRASKKFSAQFSGNRSSVRDSGIKAWDLSPRSKGEALEDSHIPSMFQTFDRGDPKHLSNLIKRFGGPTAKEDNGQLLDKGQKQTRFSFATYNEKLMADGVPRYEMVDGKLQKPLSRRKLMMREEQGIFPAAKVNERITVDQYRNQYERLDVLEKRIRSIEKLPQYLQTAPSPKFNLLDTFEEAMDKGVISHNQRPSLNQKLNSKRRSNHVAYSGNGITSIQFPCQLDKAEPTTNAFRSHKVNSQESRRQSMQNSSTQQHFNQSQSSIMQLSAGPSLMKTVNAMSSYVHPTQKKFDSIEVNSSSVVFQPIQQKHAKFMYNTINIKTPQSHINSQQNQTEESKKTLEPPDRTNSQGDSRSKGLVLSVPPSKTSFTRKDNFASRHRQSEAQYPSNLNEQNQPFSHMSPRFAANFKRPCKSRENMSRGHRVLQYL